MPVDAVVEDFQPGLRAPRRRRIPVAATRRQKSYLGVYIAVHGICFFLYAVFGKGFAYLGHEPFFVGEALLLYGLCVALKTGKASLLASTPVGIMLAVFTVWELARTLPFLSTWRIDAVRDAMLWGYSLFAWIAAAVVLRSENCLGTVIGRYRKYGGIMLVLMFASYLATLFLSARLPMWPGTTVTIPLMKAGDMCVHVAGLMVFVLVGLGTKKTWWMIPSLVVFMAGAMTNRGGMLACTLALCVAFLFYPDFRRVLPMVPGLLLALALLLSSDFSFHLDNSMRVLSTRQFVQNIESVLSSGSGVNEADLEDTKQWRLNWWTTIIDYTLRGPYFWTGKGYGVNLTVSDGIAREGPTGQALRSPHNSHLTFLARSGVPGATLWLAVQLVWSATMLRSYFLARRRGFAGWARTFIWLFAYWLAFMVNAAFDVSLEGPVCGIAAWTIFGLGWGSCVRFRNIAREARRPALRIQQFRYSHQS